jgi:hypothetical protein
MSLMFPTISRKRPVFNPGSKSPVRGAFRDVRGYGTLQPTSAGSDVTLHLTQ